MLVNKTLVMAVAAGVVGVFCQAAFVRAQAPEPRFEVASIKPNSVAGRQSLVILPNGLTATHQSLQVYIQLAYSGAGLRIVGTPEWTAQERFDISARTSAAAGRQEILAMLRTLLAERFALRTHRESREEDGYALVLAGGNRRSPGLLLPPLLNRRIVRERRPQHVAVASPTDSQHVLSNVKALRFAPTPLRGAEGPDVASARVGDALTATADKHPNGLCSAPVQNPAVSDDR